MILTTRLRFFGLGIRFGASEPVRRGPGAPGTLCSTICQRNPRIFFVGKKKFKNFSPKRGDFRKFVHFDFSRFPPLSSALARFFLADDIDLGAKTRTMTPSFGLACFLVLSYFTFEDFSCRNLSDRCYKTFSFFCIDASAFPANVSLGRGKGILKGGSITVPLPSCLKCLD